MKFVNKLSYNDNVYDVNSISFGVLSPEQILAQSVCEITKHITNATLKDKDIESLYGTLLDPRMGPIEYNVTCPTCGNETEDCVGHFGHMVLVKPVFQYQYINTIMKILSVVCFKCSKLLIDIKKSEIMSISPTIRLRYIKDLLNKSKKDKEDKSRVCWYCSTIQPKKYSLSQKYNKIVGDFVKVKDGNPLSLEFDPEIVHTIFKNITDDNICLMGLHPEYSRPEWLIMTIFPVPPLTVRPYVKIDGLQAEDDLTHNLNFIIKHNNHLATMINDKTKYKNMDDWWSALQYHIAIYVDNNSTKLPKSTNKSEKPYKTIIERLKGKTGRIRKNLMGKRVNMTGRSVITPDPSLDIDEVGIPIQIAKNLTFMEIVNELNIAEMTKLVRKGDNYLGAKAYARKDEVEKGQRKMLSHISESDREKIMLNIGDVVYRHIRDGDWAIINRQPTLHKISIMAHRIRVLSGRTLRINVNITEPYNADFDGDEMNIYIPQSYESIAELKYIIAVPNHIINTQNSTPAITFVQDSVLGSYMLSIAKYLTYSELVTLIPYVKKFTGLLPITFKDCLNDNISPIQILNYCFPFRFPKHVLQTTYDIVNEIKSGTNIVYISSNSSNISNIKTNIIVIITDPYKIIEEYNTIQSITPQENGIEIKFKHAFVNDYPQGSYLITNNPITKSKTKQLIQEIWSDYGTQNAINLYDNLSFLANHWLLRTGFSVGIADTIMSPNLLNEIKNKTNTETESINILINNITNGNEDQLTKEQREILGPDSESIKKNYSQYVTGKFVRETCEEYALKLTNEFVKYKTDHGVTNGLNVLLQCGSKGAPTNFRQMASMVGQQIIDNDWIVQNIDKRTLPHVPKDCLLPYAHGFIESSFMDGLTPTEYFYHAQSGRVGCIQKSIMTADIGYLNHKLIKNTEDVHVCHDQTVRNASNVIIQFTYGDDGFDSQYLEKYKMNFTFDSLEKRKKRFYLENLAPIMHHLTKDLKTKYTPTINDKNAPENIALVNHYNELMDLINIFRNTHKRTNCEIQTGLNVDRLIKIVTEKYMVYQNEYSDLEPKETINKINDFVDKLKINITKKYLINLIIKVGLSYKKLVELHFTNGILDILLNMIYDHINKAIVNAGEMVGILSANAIGEPVTQLTLDTFHHAGSGVRTRITYGLARFNEIVRLSHTMKQHTTIFINNNYYLDTIAPKNITSSSYDELLNKYAIKTNELISDLIYTKYKDLIQSYEITNDIDKYENEAREFAEEFLSNHDIKERHKFWLMRIVYNDQALIKSRITLDELMKLRYIYMSYDAPFAEEFYSSSISNNPTITHIYFIPTNNQDIGNVHIKENIDLFEFMVLNMEIKGIKGITDAYQIESKKENIYIPETDEIIQIADSNYENIQKQRKILPKNIIETDGSNLLELLNNDYVDKYETISNDFWEIYELFGIEAARRCLIEEFDKIMKAGGAQLNSRHIELLVDIMTSQGILLSIDRYGMNKTESGPLQKISFEETAKQILNAGLYNEKDYMNGVSGNIMFGQFIPVGTDFSKIIIDQDKLTKLEQEIEQQEYEQISHNTKEECVVEIIDDTLVKCTPEILYIFRYKHISEF